MDPQVVRVNEANQIASNGTVSKVLQITYMIGPHGPFTLYATQAEVSDGTVNRRITEFAQALRTLPLPSGL